LAKQEREEVVAGATTSLARQLQSHHFPCKHGIIYLVNQELARHPTMLNQPSSQLASQTISKRAIADLLIWLGRTKWQSKWNAHDLEIESWCVGIWVKQAGIISYEDLAIWLKFISQARSEFLRVQKRGERLYLVAGRQQEWYAVTKNQSWQCECMLFRCRRRIAKEMPKLYEALDRQIFCHHTLAASLS
jgi:hypothetical protein